MSLPLWSRHDALMYDALSQFPEKQEGVLLNVSQFRSYFRDLTGRPIQDIVEALHHYSQEGYFEHEIILAAEYYEHGKALDEVAAALSKLMPESTTAPDKYRGLSEPIHEKAMLKLPLTISEARGLPDEAKPYLTFKLSNIDRQRLREELAVYNDNEFIQPSRLVKSTHKVPSEYIAHVVMNGTESRVVCIVVTGSGDYPIAKLQVDRAPYDFMHYLFRPENSNREKTINEVRKDITSCNGRTNLTELVDDCGFNKALKGAFFPVMLNDKVRFTPEVLINRQQLDAIKKLSEKLGNKK